jgi:hypothetical protein
VLPRLQAILGWVRLLYDDGILRGRPMSKSLNGNKLLATFGGVLDGVLSSIQRRGAAAFDGIDAGTKKSFRSLAEVLAAGYKLKAKVGDEFSTAERKSVSDALRR